MVKRQDFKLDLVQAVIFTPEPNTFATGRAVGAILSHFQDRFTGEMEVLPLPADVPHEIPRVQLRSSDNQWQFSMAPARTDAIWRNFPPSSLDSLGDAVTACSEMLLRYVESLGVRVARLALIAQRFCHFDDPAKVLIERFCNESSRREPFNRSSAFEIHNHKVYAPQRDGIDYSINSWVRCKSGALVADMRPVILVEQDLNTLVQDMEGRRFDVSDMTRFFGMAAQEADEIIHRYFPD